MPKVKISEYSATANSNTDVASINIDEGCAPSGINNAIRAIMGHLKDFQSGTNGDPFNGPVNGTLGATTASTANVTTLTTSSTVTHNGGTANGVAYLNGSKVLTTGSALTFDGGTLAVSSSDSRFTVTSTGSGQTVGISIKGGAGGGSDYNFIESLNSTGTQQWYLGGNGTANVLAFKVATAEGMRLTSTSLYTASTINVGIGTSSPAYKLDVTGAINATNTSNTTVATGGFDASTSWSLKVANASTTAGTGAGIYFVGGGNSESWIGNLYESSGVGALSFQTRVSGTRAERMRIDSSGNLLVGTTSSAFSEKFNATQSADQKAGLFFNTNASFSNNVLNLRASRNTTNSSYGFLQCSIDGVADKLYIYDSGNVVNTNNSYGQISDIKLKENIVDATPKLEKLNQVRVVNFNFIGDQQKQLGVIAQELEQVFPGMIDESPDKDSEGNDLGTITKSVKYSVFVPMLIKAMQEQQAIITQLTARITALESA